MLDIQSCYKVRMARAGVLRRAAPSDIIGLYNTFTPQSRKRCSRLATLNLSLGPDAYFVAACGTGVV